MSFFPCWKIDLPAGRGRRNATIADPRHSPSSTRRSLSPDYLPDRERRACGLTPEHWQCNAYQTIPYHTLTPARAQQFITQTLAHARLNVTVNGLDLPAPSTATATASQTGEEDGVEYEPYDARLASKLQSLYLALESETMAIARLRREAPRRAAEGWRARFLEGEEGRGRAGDGEGKGEGGGERMEIDSEGAAGDVGSGTKVGMELGLEGLDERWEGVKGAYAVACEGLLGLKTGVTETVGRCERAGRAAVEVERG